MPTTVQYCNIRRESSFHIVHFNPLVIIREWMSFWCFNSVRCNVSEILHCALVLNMCALMHWLVLVCRSLGTLSFLSFLDVFYVLVQSVKYCITLGAASNPVMYSMSCCTFQGWSQPGNKHVHRTHNKTLFWNDNSYSALVFRKIQGSRGLRFYLSHVYTPISMYRIWINGMLNCVFKC